MDALRSFFAMDGYALYVWASYAAFAVVAIGVVVTSLRGMRALESELEARRAAMGRQRGGEPAEEDEKDRAA